MANRHGKKAEDKVKRAMHERKEGTLRSGSTGKKVTSRKQAIAIGLSEARRAGGKVLPKRSGAARRRSNAAARQARARAARNMATAVYSTTATTSQRSHSSGSCFTMKAAMSTPGMPPSARPSAARAS
jgi:hypothetical protein